MLKDLTNQKFNRLKVVRLHFIDKVHDYKTYWLCKCDCGNEKVILGSSLKCNAVKSCGCLHRELAKIRQKNMCYRHGKSRTKIYITWKAILIRCNKLSDKNYKNYGGRGIKCLWNSFEEFYEDMGEPPSKYHTIDRINNDGNYCKENCRWATKNEQANNRRTACLIKWNGKTQNLKTWSQELGVSYKVLWWRIKNGWSIEKAFENQKLIK